jgi:hypothetical protein
VRYHLDFRGTGVELQVPGGGEGPPVPERPREDTVESPNLLNQRYEGMDGARPRFTISGLFLVRVEPRGADLTLADMNAELAAHWRARTRELKMDPAAIPARQDPALKTVVLGGRTWFTHSATEGFFPYFTVVSPTLIFCVRGETGQRDRALEEKYRRVLEEVASTLVVIGESQK